MVGKIVIGSAFGDEGKGLFVDYLTSQIVDPVVVRFNSGAQCSHTVVTPEGKRHVFSHLGSGSFLNAPTYLSEFVVCNPLLFCKEWMEMDGQLDVMVDKNSLVTSPFDMILNQLLERTRGMTRRHGSCGIGFGETIERAERGFDTRIEELVFPGRFLEKLKHIEKEYIPTRLNELGLEKVYNDEYADMISDILKRFMIDVDSFLDKVRISTLDDIRDRNIIFEGAQGLMLDMDNGEFPHVTRSNTGLKNVLDLCEKLNITDVDVTYATRAYATRHGAGPFPTEVDGLPYSNIVETTNVLNDWQGDFRFGDLDITALQTFVYRDMEEINKYSDINFNFNIGVTCMDQVDEKMKVVVDNCPKTDLTHIEFFDLLRYTFPCFGIYRSDGPTRNDITKIN